MRETKIVIVFIGLNWRSWYKSCTKKSIKNRQFYKKKYRINTVKRVFASGAT